MKKGRQQVGRGQLGGYQGWWMARCLREKQFSPRAFFLRVVSTFQFMKTSLAVVFVCSIATGLLAQTAQQKSPAPPEDTPYTVVNRDANSRVWERTTYEQGASGEIVPHIHRYEELATGMHYLGENGEWVESKEQIDILPDGSAAALKGQQKVYFPADIYDGVLELVTSDGVHLKSRAVGIGYYDDTNSVLIAELKHSIGQVLPSGNQVIYTNAFTDFAADLLVTYRRSGLECDLVFREQPPEPEVFGLNPKQARLELLTEFFDTPEPDKVLDAKKGDEQPDVTLKFGTTEIAHGSAFSVDATQPESARRGMATSQFSTKNSSAKQERASRVAVHKTWTKLEGRTFLIEQIPVTKIESQLKALPVSAGAGHPMASVDGIAHRVSSTRLLPPARMATIGTKAVIVAKETLQNPAGFVLDYVTVNVDKTNFVFQGDTTYFISGNVNLNGSNVIEAGAVFKFSQTNYSSLNAFNTATVICKTGPYRPAIFTSQDDNSVGETISGSSGVPVTDTQNYYLQVSGSQVNLHHLRMSYAYSAITVYNGGVIDLSDLQFNHVSWPFWIQNIGAGGQSSMRNVLMSDVTGAAFELNNNTAAVEQLTLDQCSRLGWNDGGGNLYLTNSLLVRVQQMGDIPYSTNCVALISTNTGIFQTALGGNYYLAAASPYRNIGTTNINAKTLLDLQQLTTYAPMVYENSNLSVEMVFGSHALRDTNAPDLGYHYDPMDYVFGGCSANSNLTFLPGCVVGWYRTSSGWFHAGYGIHMGDNVTIFFNGLATAPTYWVRCNTVQEQDTTGGYGPGGIDSWTTTQANYPTVRARFLRSMATAGEAGNFFSDDWGRLWMDLADSEFWSGSFGGYGNYVSCTNCLMHRVPVGLSNGDSTSYFRLRNCSFIGGGLFISRISSGPTPVTVRDCAFDGVTITTSDYYSGNSSLTDFGYNAYLSGANQTYPAGSNNVVVTNGFNWQTGPLGEYYLPTNSPLINTGSISATLAGLYQFTTQTNEVRETNSTVDIGYHYVALNTSGAPLDSDANGMPDYLQDQNGNGTCDAGDACGTGAPIILDQPAMQILGQGSTATFSVLAAGANPLTYQWRKNGSNLTDGGSISGSSTRILTLSNVQTNDAAGYSVVVSNSNGSVTSSPPATLTVLVPPFITSQPTNQTVSVGDVATFTVTAGGTSPLTYQWQFNGTNISGATAATLVINNVITNNAGNYSVLIANAAGFTNSVSVTLTVLATAYTIVPAQVTNYVFKADTTYFVNQEVNLYGNTVIEGGTVIKFHPLNTCYIYASSGTVSCKTAPYRPAIFTSRDDNSVGATISTSTGVPLTDQQNYYFVTYGVQTVLHDLRMCYSYAGITVQSTGADLSNLQFVHCAWPLYVVNVTNCQVRNVLMSDVQGGAFELFQSVVNVEHLTVDQCVRFGYNDYQGNLNLTNCLLARVQQMGDIPYTTNCVVLLDTNAVPFQSAGAGNYYLADDSPYRDAGTTNISSAMLADLQQTTTYPPLVYSNLYVAEDTIFSPVAQRDGDGSPDLGYHYCPIDYLVDSFWVSNATLVVTNGAVTACYNDSGVIITDGSAISSCGTPLVPNWFTRYSSVQEEPISLGTGSAPPANGFAINGYHNDTGPGGQFRFTKFSCPANGGIHIYHNSLNWAYTNLVVQDCEFWGGQNYFGGNDGCQAFLQNNLFARSTMTAVGGTFTNNSLSLSNNLFWYAVTAVRPGGNSNIWFLFNNSFDNSVIRTNGFQQTVSGYNGYIGGSDRLYPTNIHDTVSFTNMIYQTGPLGDFYQPAGSILLDTGSCAASVEGLFHYTVTTNQVKEGSSVVDVGYHYMALDTTGNPVDSNGDGVPDWMQDANGNGTNDNDEVEWGIAISVQPSGRVVIQGSNTTFTVSVLGVTPMTYQWRFNGTNISGATGASLVLTNIQPSAAGLYSVVIGNSSGQVTSFDAALTVIGAPTIAVQPVSQTVFAGDNVLFGVVVSGTGPFGYQWRFNGSPIAATNGISGNTSATLMIDNVQLGQVGNYSVVITNVAGAITSAPAALIIGCSPILTQGAISTNTFSVYIRGAKGSHWNIIDSADLTNWTSLGDVTLDSSTGLGTFSDSGIGGVPFRFYKLINGDCCSRTIGFTRTLVWPEPATNNPGTNAMIANQLDAVTNTLDGLFNQGTNHTMPGGVSLPAGTVIEKWDGLEFTNFTWDGSSWGSAGSVTLNPGEGAFLMNPTNVPLTVTFVGLVKEGTSVLALPGGGNYQIISALLPEAGLLTGNLGFMPSNGTQVLLWNVSGYQTYTLFHGSWSGGDPNINVGQSFFARVPTNYNWQFTYSSCSNGIDIFTQPQSQTIIVTSNVTFSVSAGSSLPLTYQWFHNGTIVSGATNTSLTLTNIQASDGGQYWVVISNGAGSLTSAVAVLTVWGFPAPSGLVGWWQAESNTWDATGLNPPGTAEGTVNYVAGKVGQAFNFGGLSDVRVQVSTNVDMGANGGGLTIEGWIHPTQTNTQYSVIEADSGVGVLGSSNAPGDFMAYFVDTSFIEHDIWTSGNVIGTNAFCHIAATYDPGSGIAKLYLNGVQVATQTFGTLHLFRPGNLYLGYSADLGVDYHGQIDELGVYNRALSGAEIAAVYNEGNIGKRPIAPAILTQPAGQTVNDGDPVTLNVAVGGTSPFSYQWRLGGVQIIGAAGSSYTISSAHITNEGLYDVVVQNAVGSVTSAPALVTIVDSNSPPIITQPPIDQSVKLTGSTTFAVQALGKGLTYQWKKNGVPISGQTASTLAINNAQTTDGGNYSVSVANAMGSADAGANLLVLQIQGQPAAPPFTSYLFTLYGATAGSAYDLYLRPSINPGIKYRIFYSGSPGQTSFSCPAPSASSAFFTVGPAADTDEDGLTDGYEDLVSHSSHYLPDTDQDGLPDGWEAEWGLNSASNTGNDGASGDPDGDGVPNSVEFEQGTDPFKNNSSSTPRPEVTISVVGNAFQITRTGGTSASLTVNYTVGGTAIYSSDYTLSPAPASSFYPFSVSIPSGASSVTITPSSTVLGKTLILALVPIALSDAPDPSTWAYVVNPYSDRASLSLTVSSVNITATDPFAAQAGSWGQFTVTLPQAAGVGGVLVSYTLSTATGTAVNGADYQLISSTSVTVPASQSSVTIPIIPLNGSPFIGTKNVIITLTAAAGYTSGQINTSPATVTIAGSGLPSGIYPSTSHPIVSIVATDSDAREDTTVSDAVRQGTFTVTRAGVSGNDLNHALDVRFQVSGTATYGVDYAAFASPNVVTIPAGQTTATITVNPIDDAIPETAETVILTLQPDVTYDVNGSSNATVVIDDNEAPTYTVVAVDPVAIESPSAGGHADSGVFTVTRTGSVLASKTIKSDLDPSHGALTYHYGGSAGLNASPASSDYVPSPGFSGRDDYPDPITFQNGQFTKQVTVTPVTDARDWHDTGIGSSSRTIVLSVNDSVNPSSSDTVTLFGMLSAAPCVVTISSPSPAAVRSPLTAATFKVARNSNGDLTGTMVVFFRLDGQATPVYDYFLAPPAGVTLTVISPTVMSVTIPSGKAATTITLNPWDHGEKGVESVIVSLLPGFYQIGQQWQAALRIRDSQTPSTVVPDTDHDGIDDVTEVTSSPPTDALTPDTDGNGYPDGYSANPALDANGDGVSDGTEEVLGLLPTDFDGDGISDLREVYRGTDPSTTTSTTDKTPPTINLTSPTSPKVIKLLP